MSEFLFNKVACLTPVLEPFLILIVFPVNFAKFLRKPFFRTPPVAASEANYKFQNKLQVNCGRLAS